LLGVASECAALIHPRRATTENTSIAIKTPFKKLMYSR
jgi:hypothetical protein